MRELGRVIAVVLVAMQMSGNLFACEKFIAFSIEEQKEFREVLIKSEADSLDRLFAFQQLACSNNPNLRNYAIKEGLKKTSDPLVRNQVMLTAFMQMKRIDVELGSGGELTKADKKFIKGNAGVLSATAQYRSETEGCVSLHYVDKCHPSLSLFIKGDKVEYNFRKIYGEFRLTEADEMLGFVRLANTGTHNRIPAVIKLY